MMHFNSSNKGGRFTPGFTEDSDFEHCKPYVVSAFSNQKFLCEWLCIMTDQTRIFLHHKYDQKFCDWD